MCNVKAKSVTIATERNMFGKLLIIAQQRREISMREILIWSSTEDEGYPYLQSSISMDLLFQLQLLHFTHSQETITSVLLNC